MNINYVVACHVGNRRNPVLDPYEYVKTHLHLLDEYQDENISIITLVLNMDGDEGDEFERFVSLYCMTRPYLDERVEIIFRPNRGFSYAAWQDAIVKNLYTVNYFFLVEDDYMPGFKNFYYPFLAVLEDIQTGYCCSKVTDLPERHAGMSSGMMRADVARRIFEGFGTIFNINPHATIYGDGEWNQVHFLDLMGRTGYTFNDPSRFVSTPFYDINKNLIEYGNPHGPCPLKPILEVTA